MSNAAQGRPPTPAGTSEDQRREAAREYVRQLRVFYVHAAVAAVGVVVIFIVNLAVNMAAGLTGEWWAWWSAWALLGWGIAVAIHGLLVRSSRPNRSASSWEERQIDRILSDDDATPLR